MSPTVMESQNLPNFNILDVDSRICNFEWILHNDRRKIYDPISKKELIEYRRNGKRWENNQSVQLQKEEFGNLLDIIPLLLDYVGNFEKTCILIDECTVKIERAETE